MKFSEMEYKRFDAAKAGEEYDRLTEQTKNAQNKETVFSCIEKHEKLLRNFSTQYNIAYIRHTVDTNDEFYEKENDYYDENSPVIQEKINGFYKSLLASEFRSDLEEKYGKLLFLNLEIEDKCFSPEIVPLLQEENRLVSEYQKTVAQAQIEFDGKILNISQLGVYKISKDRETRKAAYEAEGKFYNEHTREMEGIFDKLVKCRTQIANKLGFDSFTEVGYLRNKRNCYGRKEVESYRENVVKNVVPEVSLQKAKQAERIGVDKADFHLFDDGIFYKDGNAKPKGSADDVLSAGKRMYEEMSEESKVFINYMYDNELLDVLAKKGKAVGGYCTGIPDYKAPFIFSNFNGTSGDVDVLTHEAGHAFADFQVRDFELEEIKNPTMESCETHSMSMEFLAWRYLDYFYGDEAKKAKIFHLSDALFFLPYGCMVDHFQHIVYDKPELTPEQRNEEWAKLERLYRPYLSLDGMTFYGEGKGWQRQHHIFTDPFYYIDYVFAQTAALEIWAMSQSDYADAFSRYMKFVRLGGTKTFKDLLSEADIDSPFKSGTLENIVKTAACWLGDNNK